MDNIPYYSGQDVRASLKYSDLIPVLEEALADFSRGPNGGVNQPFRATAEVRNYNGFLTAMPAHVSSQHALACKLVTFYPDNFTRHQVDTHMAHILLFDETTGMIQSIMDGEVITAMRTAAVSVIATKCLAASTEVVAVLGSGVQARNHIEAFFHSFQIKKIHLWNHRVSGAEALAKWVNEVFPSIQVQVFDRVEECVKEADVIVTATFATEPILDLVPMKPEVHINSVGAPRPTWSEMTPSLVKNCTVYVDSFVSASRESGDVILAGGAEAVVYAEIGEVLLGNKKPEKNRQTIFKSLGLALEDAVAARLVHVIITEKKI